VESKTKRFHYLHYVKKDILAIEIYLNRVEGKWRLDKTRRYFGGWSTGEIRSVYSSRSKHLDRFSLSIPWGGNIIGDNAYKLKFTKSD
jgi:hypothetical protein